MFSNPAVPALLKIAATFVVMLFLIHRNWGLWLAILTGGVVLGLLFGMSPLEIGATVLQTIPQPSFLILFSVVAFIMLLSEVQGATGQGQRLVAGLSPYMKSRRLRLIFFPALVGLLPMPGGAIFSCPMVRDVAEHLDITNRQKVLINYWFRHIWEAAWPLYPGYILACALADIPPSLLWRYGIPFVFISLAVGWVALLRAPVESLPDHVDKKTEKQPLGKVLMEGLPIAVAIFGAFAFEILFSALGLALPNGMSFVCSFFAASLTAIIQNRLAPADVAKLIFQSNVAKMLALILMIFIFKELVIKASVVDSLATLISGRSALLALFLFLPIVMGALTGLMMGFVGASFPLLMGLLVQAGLYEERLSWVLLALAAGNFGQMVSPLHSCYLVTLEFFKVPFSRTFHTMFAAMTVHFALCCVYVAALYFLFRPLL